MNPIVRSLLLLIGLAVLPACAASERATLPPQAQPVAPVTTPVAANPPATRSVVVHFDNDSADIRAAAMQALYGAAVELRGARLTSIRITGFADGAGRRSHNQKLSERRAAAVADQLGKLGLGAERIEVKGAGEIKGKLRRNKVDRRVEIAFEYEQDIAAVPVPYPTAATMASDATAWGQPLLAAPAHSQVLPQASLTSPQAPAPLRSGGKPAIKLDLVLDGTAWLPPPGA